MMGARWNSITLMVNDIATNHTFCPITYVIALNFAASKAFPAVLWPAVQAVTGHGAMWQGEGCMYMTGVDPDASYIAGQDQPNVNLDGPFVAARPFLLPCNRNQFFAL